ncbi:MAG TPA: SDR family oxidoreductase [Bryobacteraceae bacterium]|nr:SDR family oxidoreductase [Bryobacteraceae bacterium]
MNGFLSNKIAVVTGATKGIGRSIAESLAREGASVAICGRSQTSAETVAKEIAAATGGAVEGTALDVRDPIAVTKFFNFVDDKFGALDILVNNAGIGIFSPVADLTYEAWKETLDTNLSGVFYCCKEGIPRLQRRGGGSIINISSLAGRNPFNGGAAYNASKFGLNGFSEAMMLDHRNDKIRVTYVMPGSVDTGFSPRSAPANWKIAAQDVADVVIAVLRMPERTTISRVEMRPSIPPK